MYGPRAAYHDEWRLYRVGKPTEHGASRRLVGTYASKRLARAAAERSPGRYECDAYRVVRQRGVATTTGTLRGRSHWYVERGGVLRDEEVERLRERMASRPAPTPERVEAAMARFDAPDLSVAEVM